MRIDHFMQIPLVGTPVSIINGYSYAGHTVLFQLILMNVIAY